MDRFAACCRMWKWRWPCKLLSRCSVRSRFSIGRRCYALSLRSRQPPGVPRRPDRAQRAPASARQGNSDLRSGLRLALTCQSSLALGLRLALICRSSLRSVRPTSHLRSQLDCTHAISFFYDFASDIGEPKITTLESIRQFQVIQNPIDEVSWLASRERGPCLQPDSSRCHRSCRSILRV